MTNIVKEVDVANVEKDAKVGSFEIHIFILPNEKHTYQDFKKLCDSITAEIKCKALHLYIKKNRKDYVDVYQTTIRILHDNVQDAVKRLYYYGDLFKSKGFDVIRHKLELEKVGKDKASRSVFDTKIQPDNVKNGKSWYSEYHIKLSKVVNNNIDESKEEKDKNEEKMLNIKDFEGICQPIAYDLTHKFNNYFSLSYNSVTEQQRFINFRLFDAGLDEMDAYTAKIQKYIQDNYGSKVSIDKFLKEVGAHDDGLAVDQGWLPLNEKDNKQLIAQSLELAKA